MAKVFIGFLLAGLCSFLIGAYVGSNITAHEIMVNADVRDAENGGYIVTVFGEDYLYK